MNRDNLARDKETKLLNYREFFEERVDDNLFAYGILEEIKVRSERNAISNADFLIKKKIEGLEADVKRKQIKLQMAIPTGMVACLIIIICMIVGCVTIFACQLIANIKILDYYILLFIITGCCGLLHTSINTFKCWKRFIENDE